MGCRNTAHFSFQKLLKRRHKTSDNRIVQNLENILEVWNRKLNGIRNLLTQLPKNLKDRIIWKTIVNINGSLQAISLIFLVLSAQSGAGHNIYGRF